ncbi:MAG: FtsX-like permease family protein [Gemmatimonadota bacterium]
MILSAASAALCGVALGLFERTPAGMRPFLQPAAIPESGWLSAPTARHRAFEAVQESASIGVGQTVFLVLLAGVLVAGIALWSLLLTRHTQRKSEFATRSALGASPRELFIELAAPVARVAAIGTVFGVLSAAVVVLVVMRGWAGVVEVGVVRSIVRAFAGALVCAAVLAAGSIATLWLFMMRGPLADRLRAGTRATGTLGERRVRELMTSAQVGACVSLLAVAVALSDLPERSNSTDPAMPQLWVADAGFTDESLGAVERSARIEALLRAESGFKPESIASAGAVLGATFQDQLYSECDECLRGYVPIPVTQITLPMHSVGPGYFGVVGSRLVGGRDFSLSDRIGAAGVVIVNSSYALQVFGRNSPLGRVVRLGSALGAEHRIVGVVEDRSGTVLGSSGPRTAEIFFAALQHPPLHFDLLRSDPTDVVVAAPGLRADAYVPLADVERAAQAPLRQTSVALRILAILCFALGALGLHATTAALVTAQRRALGIRLALGSTAAGLAGHVSAYSARLVGVGIVLGVWLAVGAQQWLELVLPHARIHADAFLLAAGLLIVMTAAGAVQPVLRVVREPPANPLAD